MKFNGTFAEPKVTLIAKTTLTEDFPSHVMEIQDGSSDAETLVTFGGRGCYESYHRPSEATRLDADYIERTLFEQKHLSISEHASATFLIEGVSRSFTHELVRHRHLGFSQASQRFIDESDTLPVCPPAIEALDSREVEWILGSVHEDLTDIYASLVDALQAKGYPRKQAREAARSVLPNMTETHIVVSGNLRSWIEFLEKRMAKGADAEIRKVAGMIQKELAEKVSPVVFGRFENE